MKKALAITKKVLTWALVVLSIGMMIFTVISVNTFNKKDKSIFGYKAFIVLSDSMSTVNGDADKGYFDAGDLIFVKYVKASSLKPGDIISYESTNTENIGETVTHKIKELTTDAEGNPGFITYGTSTGEEDANVVIYDYVIGKYEFSIPNVGTFFEFLQTTQGYIICIFIPFLLLIVIQGFNSIRLFKKYKKEQVAELEAQREKERAEIEAERAEMAEERKRQEEMMRKLLEMQAAMQGTVPVAESPKPSEIVSADSSTDKAAAEDAQVGEAADSDRV